MIRDKRRIDPETGRLREPAGTAAPAGPEPPTAGTARREAELAERTADLQRLQAEYVNYKRRVDRDRDLVRDDGGRVDVLRELLPVLDDIALARGSTES